MPTRAACAGYEVPAAWPHRGRAAARQCSPTTSSHPSVPRIRCDPSPSDRLSRPPSTTVAPPHPVSNSGRCACPGPAGPAGADGVLPTFTINRSAGSTSSYTPVASPRGNRNAPRSLTRPIS